MFTAMQNLSSRCWLSVIRPHVRLQAEFPWTFSRMTSEYMKALGLYILGSFLPLVLWIIVQTALLVINPELLLQILGRNLENMTTIIVAVSVTSFVCGFGLQVWYINRVLRQDKHSLRQLLAINLDALGGSWWQAIWRSAAAVVIALGLNQIVHLLLPLPAPRQEIAEFIKHLTGLNLLAIGLLAAVAAPLFEEVVFRGFLFNMLRTQFGRGRVGQWLKGQNGADWAASAVSAAIFAAAHLEPSAMPGFVPVRLDSVRAVPAFRQPDLPDACPRDQQHPGSDPDCCRRAVVPQEQPEA